MPEHRVRTEALRIGTPLAVGSVTLLCIESVQLQGDRGRGGAWCRAEKVPYVLIVRDGDGVHAVGCGAAVPSLEALRARIPELDTVLAAM